MLEPRNFASWQRRPRVAMRSRVDKCEEHRLLVEAPKARARSLFAIGTIISQESFVGRGQKPDGADDVKHGKSAEASYVGKVCEHVCRWIIDCAARACCLPGFGQRAEPLRFGGKGDLDPEEEYRTV